MDSVVVEDVTNRNRTPHLRVEETRIRTRRDMDMRRRKFDQDMRQGDKPLGGPILALQSEVFSRSDQCFAR